MKTENKHRYTLNAEQKRAIGFGEGPLLVIAGAGTGKTTVVTERIAHLITKKSVRPDGILALTFTEKASREMEERIDMLLPYGLPDMWISTFHAFCDRILRAEAINIGYDPGYRLMTEAETIQFFRRHLFSFDLSYFRPLGNPTKFIAGMLQHFSRLKDEDITPEQYLGWVKDHIFTSVIASEAKQSQINKRSPRRKNGLAMTEGRNEEGEKYFELARAYRTYEELKVKEGVADYADLISNTLKLFRTRKNILKRYQDQFRYILIDEFQDTNFAQNELAVLLAGKKKNLTVVGDDDQAIYRWRGAAISNIIQFRKRFPRAKIVVLTKNYRSTQEILNRSYALIQQNNPDRLEIAERIDKKLESMRRINGSPIEVLYRDRVENEAEGVAQAISNIKHQTSENQIREGGYDWKDFAILVRANSHAEPFSRALERAGIPYQFLGPGQLFRQAEVKDLISYLKLLTSPDDSVAMYRVLSMDLFAIHPRDLAALMQYARTYGQSLFEACETLLPPDAAGDAMKSGTVPVPKLSENGTEKILRLIRMIYRHLALIKKESAGQILYYFLEDTGLLKTLASYKNAKDERRALNIAKFFDKLKTYEAEHDDAGVYPVSDWIELSSELGESPLAADTDWVANDAVTILTVHSSKGLEFPVVFLVNLVSARFPTIGRKEQIPLPDPLIKEILPTGDFHIEEERRLFYVGMTRARDRLYFSAARYYGEGKREKKLSPFIAEALGETMREPVPEEHQEALQLAFRGWEKDKQTEDDQETGRAAVTYLSYSQLETYKTCPLQYRYRYILKIPVPPRAALSFGSTMHRVIEAFYRLVQNNQHPTKDTLLALFDRQWSPVGYGNKAYEEKMKARGRELLAGYFDHGYDPKRVPLALEQAFRIKITPALTLGGKIDRVDPLPDGKIEIIDYKTGHAPKSRDAADDFQLTVYALAATGPGMAAKKPDDVIVSFYFFEGQEKLSASRTDEQLARAKSEIAGKAEEIARSDFHPTPGKQCDFCDFRLICEAWQ
ncbi:ATP-dependent helicase [Patescibacteria group bacterium]|nr:ATP-dependent helicase [Patescibacteria group bacterium]